MDNDIILSEMISESQSDEIEQVRKIIQRNDTPYKELQKILQNNNNQDPNIKKRIQWLRKKPVYWGLLPKLVNKIDDPILRLEEQRRAVRECCRETRKRLRDERDKEKNTTTRGRRKKQKKEI